MKNPFWKVYKITLVNQKNSLNHISFYCGYTWNAVKSAVKFAEEKGVDWACKDITRIY